MVRMLSMQKPESGGRPSCNLGSGRCSRDCLAALAAVAWSVCSVARCWRRTSNNGKVLYNTRWSPVNAAAAMAPVTAPTRWTGKTRIQLGENAGNIANAINNLVVQMAFLRGHVTNTATDRSRGPRHRGSDVATGQPVAQVSPPTLSFGAVAGHRPRRSRSPSPTPAPCRWPSGVVQRSGFRCQLNCSVVAISASCTVNVIFTPSATGAATPPSPSCTTRGGSSTVTASGSGSAAAIQVPATLVFPPTVVGSSSSQQFIEVRNTGSLPLPDQRHRHHPEQGARFQASVAVCRRYQRRAIRQLFGIVANHADRERRRSGTVGDPAQRGGGNSAVALSGVRRGQCAANRVMTEYRYARSTITS